MVERNVKNRVARLFMATTFALSGVHAGRAHDLQMDIVRGSDSVESVRESVVGDTVDNLETIRNETVVNAGYSNYQDYLDNVRLTDSHTALSNQLALKVATINGILQLLESPDFGEFRSRFEFSSFEDVVNCVDLYTAFSEFGAHDAERVGVAEMSDGNYDFVFEDDNESRLNRSLLEFKHSQLVYMKKFSVDRVRENHEGDLNYVDHQGNLTTLGRVEAMIIFAQYYEPIRDLDLETGHFYHPQLYSNLMSRSANVPDNYVHVVSRWLGQFSDEARLQEYNERMDKYRSMYPRDFAIVSPIYNAPFYEAVRNSEENGAVFPANVYLIQRLGADAYSVYGDVMWSRGDPNIPSITGRTIHTQYDHLVNYYAGGWSG